MPSDLDTPINTHSLTADTYEITFSIFRERIEKGFEGSCEDLEKVGRFDVMKGWEKVKELTDTNSILQIQPSEPIYLPPQQVRKTLFSPISVYVFRFLTTLDLGIPFHIYESQPIHPLSAFFIS